MGVPGRQLRSHLRESPASPWRARGPQRPRPHAAGVTRSHAADSLTRERRWLTPGRLFVVIALVSVFLGWRLPTERYITPERGLGYALGIVGGSMMLLLLLYSARKRVSWLGFLGSVTRWFDVHIVLGVLGPILILYHSNFDLGATNSNVALFCMLIVVGSGLIGRYIYSHIQFGLYGRKLSLEELQGNAERLRALESTIPFLPELISRLDAHEKRLLASGPRLPLLALAKPLAVAMNGLRSRWQLRRYVRQALRIAARQSPAIAAQRKRLRRAAGAYIDTRLIATRRVAAFEAYERLFSLWHVLHLSMFFMLLVAGVIHVIAMHVY